MNDADKLNRMRLFLAACADVIGWERESAFPYDHRILVQTIVGEAADGNAFASRFLVLTNVAGKHSPDVTDGLMLCQSAGTAFRRYEHGSNILILLGRHQVESLKDSPEFQGARHVALKYLAHMGKGPS